MRKYLFAAVALVIGVGSADALMIAVRPAAQRAITAEVVVVGKVTAIEKDTVDAAPFPGAKEKVAYKVAVVKIESALSGVKEVTHVKIGFVPPKPVPAPVPVPPGGLQPIRPIRPGFQAPELKEGQEMLFFLAKHPSADFYVIPGMSPPVDASTDSGKKELEAVKKALAVLADPLKGLKSDKAEERLLTATTLVTKYRAYPEAGGEVAQVAIGAEESKLILKALAEANWSHQVRPGADLGASPMTVFYQLGLTDKDGWKPVAVPPTMPGQPPIDFNALTKDAFVRWLNGPGKDYQIKKNVPKKAEK